VNELGLTKEYLSLFLNNRGLAYYHLKNFTDAIKDFDDAISSVDGTNSENFFNRGNVYLNMEEYRLAHADFDQAIFLNKNEAKFRHAKGLAF
jgi:tetratricopeptide (TPR) repeat protein